MILSGADSWLSSLGTLYRFKLSHIEKLQSAVASTSDNYQPSCLSAEVVVAVVVPLAPTEGVRTTFEGIIEHNTDVMRINQAEAASSNRTVLLLRF